MGFLNEVVIIPKSTKELSILEIFAVFDFYLSKENIVRIDQFNQEHQVGSDTITLISKKY